MQSVPAGHATGGLPIGPAAVVTTCEMPKNGAAAGCCGMVYTVEFTVASAVSVTSIEIGAAGDALFDDVTSPVRLANELAAASAGGLSLMLPVVSPTATPVTMDGM